MPTVSGTVTDTTGNTATWSASWTVDSPLPLVQPVSAEAVRQRWRVCDRANSPGLPYSDRAGCIALVKEGNYAGTRGFLVKGQNALDTAAALDAGRSWCATLIPAGALDETTLRAKIAWIAANPTVAAKVTEFEGPNEWNNDLSNWSPAAVIRAHWIMKDEKSKYANLAGIKLVGASCHDVRNAERNGADYVNLTAARWNGFKYTDLIDYQALHAYPKGDDLDTGLDQRVGWIRNAGITAPIVITETGWQRVGGDPGGVRVTAAEASILAQRAVLIAQNLAGTYGLVWASRYELRVDAQGGDMWGIVDGAGVHLAEFDDMKAFLATLLEPGAANYVPVKLGLTVSGPANWVVTGKTNGTYVLHLWDETGASNPYNVTVTDRNGPRQESVGRVPRHVTVA